MADQILTDAQLAELALAPESASDDAGAIKNRSLKDIIALQEHLDQRATSRRRKPFRVLLPTMPAAVNGPCGD